jgi:AraC family transcriptional regulator
MNLLVKGTYSGNLDKSICDGYIFACTTSYDRNLAQEQMHCHENPHISFVLNGGSLEKRRNREVERQPGKITFYHSGEYHQSTNIIHSSKHINLEIEQSFLTEYEIVESAIDETINRNNDAKFLLLRVYKELTVADELSAISIRMLLLDLINYSLPFHVKEKRPKWIIEIENIIQIKWDEHLSLNDLSTAVNVHPVTISKMFHKYHSCTLGQYMRKLKIEKALTLIKTSNYSLTEIAFECGFADQSHFTRTFKHMTGLLPHDYQKA